MFKKLTLFFLSDFTPFVLNTLIFALLLSRMTSDSYGRYLFFVSIFALCMAIINFGMNYSGVTIVLENSDSQKVCVREIIKLRVFITVFLAFFFFLLYVLNLLNIIEAILLSGACFLQCFQLDFVNIALQKPKKNLIARVSQSSFFLITIFYTTNKETLASTVILLQIISIGIAALYYYLFSYLSLNQSSNLKRIDALKIFQQGYKTTIAQLLQTGYLNADIIILTIFSKNSILIGQYGAALKLLSSGLIPMGSILNSFSSDIVAAFQQKNVIKIRQKINQLFKISLLTGFLGASAIFFFGYDALVFISRRELPIAKQIMPILSLIYFCYGFQLAYAATLPYFKLYNDFIRVSSIILFLSSIASILIFLSSGFRYMPLGSLIGTLAFSFFSYQIYLSFLKKMTRSNDFLAQSNLEIGNV